MAGLRPYLWLSLGVVALDAGAGCGEAKREPAQTPNGSAGTARQAGAGSDAGAGADAGSSAGGTDALMGAAGNVGAGGSALESMGGATACDDAPEDPIQHQCRLVAPDLAVCDEPAKDGWVGCYAGGCYACTNALVDYPFYFDWHPCCMPNITCNRKSPVQCNERCPAPTEHDKVPPCSALLR